MTEKKEQPWMPSRGLESNEMWYRVLTAFPFLFFPIVASIGLAISMIVPLVRGFYSR